MLTLPHAVALTGIRAGVPLIVCYTLISMWTVHLLNALYLEYKRSKVSAHHQRPHTECQSAVPCKELPCLNLSSTLLCTSLAYLQSFCLTKDVC